MGQPGGLLLVATVVAALASTVCSAVAWSGAASGRGERAARSGRALLVVTAALAVGATASLGCALLTNDFSLVYVADHSRRVAHAAYRLGGLWGGMAGSLLFWTALLAVVSALGAANGVRLGAIAVRAQLVLGAVVAVFALTTLLLANPFELLQVPAIDGGGLTPILEHPAMLYHPPLLYLGLVTLAVPFARTVGLLLGPPDAGADEARATVTRWVLGSWTLLALGMVAGANWAYVEVGWGGYWAWDPIENTALVPWLASTAYLHARQLDRRSPGFGARLGDALALAGFVLSSIGVVLTRSGAASSVHAFAQAVAVGRALTAVAVALLVLAVVAFVRGRAGTSVPARRWFAEATWRDRTLVAQVVLVVVTVALVLIGMLAPIVRAWFGGADSSVEGSYYAAMTGPIAVALVLLTIVGPRLSTEEGAEVSAGSRSITAIAVAVAVTLAVGIGLGRREDEPAMFLAPVAAAAVVSAVDLGWRAWRRRGRLAGHVAHLGVGLLLLGVAGSTAATVTTAALSPGVPVVAGGLTVRSAGASTEPGPPPRVLVPVEVTRGGQTQTLVPSIDGYPERGAVLAETALWSTPLEDVQLTLRRADDAGGAVIDVRRRPLAMLVWWGGLALVAAGFVALVEHRRSARLRSRPEDVLVEAA